MQLAAMIISLMEEDGHKVLLHDFTEEYVTLTVDEQKVSVYIDCKVQVYMSYFGDWVTADLSDPDSLGQIKANIKRAVHESRFMSNPKMDITDLQTALATLKH